MTRLHSAPAIVSSGRETLQEIPLHTVFDNHSYDKWPDHIAIECQVLPGLAEFALAEIERRLPSAKPRIAGDTAVQLTWFGPPRPLLQLKTVVAVHIVISIKGRRPSTLLSHQNLGVITYLATRIRKLKPTHTFNSFRLSAAGRDSRVLRRFREALGAAIDLPYDEHEGELLIRIRPDLHHLGWEVLLRLTPRPLSVRKWRVCDLPGAVNPTIAAAMVDMTEPEPTDRFFNPMCGSGTLLIERLHRGPASIASGSDLQTSALRCAQNNLHAAGLSSKVDLFVADVGALPVPDNYFNKICVDPPWGHLVGSHADNEVLYPSLLKEMTRVTNRDVQLILLTHDLKRFERMISSQDAWKILRSTQVYQGGHRPRMYDLRKSR